MDGPKQRPTRIRRGPPTHAPEAHEDTRWDDTALPMKGYGDKPLPPQRVKRVRFKDLPPDEQNNRRVETCVVYNWQRHGRKPTVDVIAKHTRLPPDDIIRALQDPVVLANLRSEGVLTEADDTYQDSDGGTPLLPSRQQMAALEVVLNNVDPDNSDSFATHLRSIGVTLKQWRGWMRDPVFASYVRDASARLFGDHDAALDVALLRQAVGGNVAALKLSYELTGRLSPTGGTSVDMMGVVSRIMEILARRLDPATLTLIAEDIENMTAAINGPNTPAPPRPALPPQVIDITDTTHIGHPIVNGEGDDEHPDPRREPG